VTQHRLDGGTSPEFTDHRVPRRQRARHIRRRRRDLVFDGMVAVGLTAVLITVTPGLGVVAIVDVIIAVALLGSVIVERRFGPARRRRHR
jgi:hypothetical protein